MSKNLPEKIFLKLNENGNLVIQFRPVRKQVFFDTLSVVRYPFNMRVGIYARVSTHDQQTLPMQLSQMKAFIKNRKWTLTAEFKEIGSGAKLRPQREELLKMARRRELDAILVWKLGNSAQTHQKYQ